MKSLRILFGLVLGFSLVHGAFAHRFAPSLLNIQEITPLHYNLVWKTPAQGVSNVPLRPLWPESCEVTNASEPQLEDTGVVTSWQLQSVNNWGMTVWWAKPSACPVWAPTRRRRW